MTEKDLLNQLKKSAEQTNIPDSLAPEKIARKLKPLAQKPRHNPFSPLKTASAAAVVLLCGMLLSTAYYGNRSIAETNPNDALLTEDGQTEKTSQTGKTENVKHNAGDLYTVAKNYDQIYDALESYCYDEGVYEAATSDTSDTTTYDSAEAATGQEIVKLSASAENGNSDKENFSQTNLQTEGVDESDQIKTDGRYIYTADDRKVFVTDTADGDLKVLSVIQPDLSSADSILELYVDDGTLLLLTERYDTILEDEAYDTDSDSYSEDTSSGFLPLEDSTSSKKAYIQTEESVTLYIYDINDPANPQLSGSISQDGLYHTSRKIGDIVYLFTSKNDLADNVSYEKERGGMIPCINGEKIPAGHIYLPNESNGDEGFVISSVNVKNPAEILDQVMIVHNFVNVYVGTDSIYLYQTDYKNDTTMTQIAKFSIENGMINAVNAASVEGDVLDTFAINEYQNTLRLLTTCYEYRGEFSGTTENRLYLFDKDLNLTGSLSGIAQDEEIYAARFLGNTAYFITYQNTDPLFAADLSDPSNPVLLGELEITGFSEYLHFWGEDKLFGIGYETNPDTGSVKGLKLVMFDISNPSDLKIADTLVLDKYCYSSALYDYKSILASPGKNLIGFTADLTKDEDGRMTDYHVYSWENGNFSQKLIQKLSRETIPDTVRGIYIGDRFYIADPGQIIEFDMKNGFEQTGRLNLKEAD